MLGKYQAQNDTDSEGNPTGGNASGVGISISWQDGPLGRGEDRKEPNGAFVETVIDIAIQRIEHYQRSKFTCRENALAITKLEEALHWLNSRTQSREEQAIEGTHKVGVADPQRIPEATTEEVAGEDLKTDPA